MADGLTASSTLTMADGVYPLPGYTRRTIGSAELVARDNVFDELALAVRKHGTLYAWARGQQQSRALSGRAPVYVAAIADKSQTTVVVRHAWHGGMLAPITGDRFLRPTRAPLELMRSHMLRECGIPTPEVVAFALYPAGPALARVDVATRYVPDSFDLAVVLAGTVPDITREQAFNAIDVLLPQLARNGFIHPDLNVKNILLHRDGVKTVATVLDVDVMVWDQHLAPVTITQRNAERLLRSLIKARRQFGVSFTDSERDGFVDRALAELPDEIRARHKAAGGASH